MVATPLGTASATRVPAGWPALTLAPRRQLSATNSPVLVKSTPGAHMVGSGTGWHW